MSSVAGLQAVVFDMDGVVIDSEPNHYRAICEAIGEGMTLSYEDFLERFAGRDERFAMGEMAKELGIPYDEDLFQEWSNRKAKAYAQFVSEHAEPMPGAVDFVTTVARAMPVGLATGSRRSDVNAALRVLAGGRLEGVFQTIVTSRTSPTQSLIRQPISRRLRTWAFSRVSAWPSRIPRTESNRPRRRGYG